MKMVMMTSIIKGGGLLAALLLLAPWRLPIDRVHILLYFLPHLENHMRVADSSRVQRLR